MKKIIRLAATASLLFAHSYLAAQTEEPPASDQGFWQTLAMLAIFIGFFYIIMWRPEQKRRKALETQRNSLQKGDKVIAMGIIGTVIKTVGESVILKMYDGTKLEFLKAAITDVVKDESKVFDEQNKKEESSKKDEE